MVAVTASAAIALAVVIPLVPGQTHPTSPTAVPTFFTSSAVDAIPSGSVVLAYPYPDMQSTAWWSIYVRNHDVMLDQAIAGMRFKLIGGYGWFPSSTGPFGTISPALLAPQSVQALFDVAYAGGTPAERALLKRSDDTADLRLFLRRYDVGTVMVVPLGGQPASVVSDVTAAIGPPVELGGVTVWLHVKKRLAAVTP